jgi:hypothetical protein
MDVNSPYLRWHPAKGENVESLNERTFNLIWDNALTINAERNELISWAREFAERYEMPFEAVLRLIKGGRKWT